ncbi:hypothetical protein ACFYZ2_31600 [Streptomyces sviceus]|uniref:hypothetical protein n=1 Tax=Streptomyces sviceus TaxID=285530 RepID=UPI0036B7DB7D
MRQQRDLGECREVIAVLSRDLLVDGESFDSVEAIGPLLPKANRHSGDGPVLDDLPRHVEGSSGRPVAAGEMVESPLGSLTSGRAPRGMS